MIGIWAEEDFTAIEFKPVFAKSKYGFALVIKKPLPDKMWGEYGFSFSQWTCWWQWKNTCTPIDFDRVKGWIAKKLHRIF